MNCQSCFKPKANLSPRKSSIINGVVLLQCDGCRENKFEPRHLIVVVARSKGAAAVRDQIVKRLYVGDDITGAELIP